MSVFDPKRTYWTSVQLDLFTAMSDLKADMWGSHGQGHRPSQHRILSARAGQGDGPDATTSDYAPARQGGSKIGCIRGWLAQTTRQELLDDLPPFPPVRGAHVNARFGFGVNPSAKNASAGKYECVCPIKIDDGELNIANKRCCGYRLPRLIAFQLCGRHSCVFVQGKQWPALS